MPPAERATLPWGRVRAWLLLVDSIAVAGGLSLAYFLRFSFGVMATLRAIPPTPLWVLPVLFVTWLLALGAGGAYQRRNTVSGIGEYQRLATAGIATLLSVILFSYIRPDFYVARGYLILAFLFVTTFLTVGRFVIRRRIYDRAGRGICLDRVVVAGTNRQALAVARQLDDSPPASCTVVGFLSDYLPVGAPVMPGLEVIGDPMHLREVAAAHGATRALVVESGLSWESLREIVREMHRADGLEISLVPGLFDLHSTSMAAHQIGPVLTLSPHPARVVGADAVLKRSLYLVVGAVALVVASPLLAALYGRAWLRREVVLQERFVDGRGEFTMLRFAGPRWAAEHHLTRLSNLPMVMRGRMSLLGPRPIPAGRADEYADARALLDSAKPGFMGPWRLAGVHRPAELVDELAYDVYYLRNCSIWFDLHMLIQAARGIRGREVSIRGPRPIRTPEVSA